jgi:hypothetical protein
VYTPCLQSGWLSRYPAVILEVYFSPLAGRSFRNRLI